MRKYAVLPLALVALCYPKVSWKPLFDGKSFNGWHVVGAQNVWKLGVQSNPNDSSIVGFSTTRTGYSMVFSDNKTFDQFTVKYSYRLKAGCSGFFFRSKETSSGAFVEGCQVEAKYLAVDATHNQNMFGNIYCWPTNKWMTDTKAPFWVKAAKPDDQYQEVVVTVKKPFVYVNMNGFQAVGAKTTGGAGDGVSAWDYSTDKNALNPGQFALQIHDGQNAMDVAFRNISILEGCGTTTAPGFDGANVPGLVDQPAVYQDNNTCTGTPVLPNGKLDYGAYFGQISMNSDRLSVDVNYEGANSLDIVNLDGKIVYSATSPNSRTYSVGRKLESGIYVAKLHVGSGFASRKIVVP